MAKISSLLGSRIKTRLADLNHPQTWLAARLELSNESISRWIKGDSDPKFTNLVQMARELECSVGYLAGDQNDKSIAEVVRRMELVSSESREKVLAGVIAVLATMPLAENSIKKTA